MRGLLVRIALRVPLLLAAYLAVRWYGNVLGASSGWALLALLFAVWACIMIGTNFIGGEPRLGWAQLGLILIALGVAMALFRVIGVDLIG
jgi:hypothetical protein